MGGSLPEMGDWDAVFDETYLQTYEPFVDPERTRAEALGAAGLADVEPGAEILDCPCGYGRHSLVLADEGYRVTGLDRSAVLLAEAERRRGEAEWPRLVRGDYRELPFEDASFDAVFTLFTSLGYLERDEDVGVLRELRRVLRPGGALIVETGHRDALARGAQRHAWQRLPDGSLYLESARSTGPQERSRSRGSSSRPRAIESSVLTASTCTPQRVGPGCSVRRASPVPRRSAAGMEKRRSHPTGGA